MLRGKSGGSLSRMELLFQRQIRSIPTAESPVGLWLPDGRPPGRTSSTSRVSFGGWGSRRAKKKGLNRIIEVMKKFRRIMMMILKCIYIYTYFLKEDWRSGVNGRDMVMNNMVFYIFYGCHSSLGGQAWYGFDIVYQSIQLIWWVHLNNRVDEEIPQMYWLCYIFCHGYTVSVSVVGPTYSIRNKNGCHSFLNTSWCLVFKHPDIKPG